MAKRRKLEAPSAADMDRFEAEFRRETSTLSPTAPIAQVAAETADAFQSGTVEERADRARIDTEAAAFREANDTGRVILEIPLDQIDPQSLPRDRTTLEKTSMDELEFSIEQHGLRLPIEIYALQPPNGNKRYGLLSGYRRLVAQQNVYARTGLDNLITIKAVLRDPNQMGGSFVAMVEENEIRQDLSHFERGRIAVIAAQQGAFQTTEEAVAEMFAAASKAKRSKIRSFGLIFEELGDVLSFPEALREKDGLRLAQALRNGGAERLRDVLAAEQETDPAREWASIEKALTAQSPAKRDPSKGGRPKNVAQRPPWTGGDAITTTSGIVINREAGAEGFVIRFNGKGVCAELMDDMMLDIWSKLEKL